MVTLPYYTQYKDQVCRQRLQAFNLMLQYQGTEEEMGPLRCKLAPGQIALSGMTAIVSITEGHIREVYGSIILQQECMEDQPILDFLKVKSATV